MILGIVGGQLKKILLCGLENCFEARSDMQRFLALGSFIQRFVGKSGRGLDPNLFEPSSVCYEIPFSSLNLRFDYNHQSLTFRTRPQASILQSHHKDESLRKRL